MGKIMIIFGIVLGVVILSGLASSVNKQQSDDAFREQKMFAAKQNACLVMFGHITTLHSIIEKNNFSNSQTNLELSETIGLISNTRMSDYDCWENVGHLGTHPFVNTDFIREFDLFALGEKISAGTKMPVSANFNDKIEIKNPPSGTFSFFLIPDLDFELIPKTQFDPSELIQKLRPHEYQPEFVPTPNYCAMLFDEGIGDWYHRIQTIENPSVDDTRQIIKHVEGVLIDLANLDCWNTTKNWNQLSRHQNVLEKLDVEQIKSDTQGFKYQPGYVDDEGNYVYPGGTFATVKGNVRDVNKLLHTYGDSFYVSLSSPWVEDRVIGDARTLDIKFQKSGTEDLVSDVGFNVRIFKDGDLISKSSTVLAPYGVASYTFDYKGKGHHVYIVNIVEIGNETIPKETAILSH